jgi:hypothetical protein
MDATAELDVSPLGIAWKSAVTLSPFSALLRRRTPQMNKVAMSVLVDNGIFEIYIGADGKLHIRWILPDPPPDLLAELRAVAVVLNEASQLKNKATAEKFQQFAETILASRAKEVAGVMEHTTQVARAS